MTGEPTVAFLNAVDWVVPGAAAASARLADVLAGLVVTGDLDLPTHGFATVFYRSEASMGELPTRIQFVTLSPPDRPAEHGCWVAPFTPMQEAQGLSRPQRIHGTVLVVTDFDSTRQWLVEREIPHFVEEPCSHLPYQRIWVGWDETGLQRVPDVDGGIFLEFIPIEVFPSVVRNAAHQVPVAPDVPVRVSGRIQLVPDVAASSRQLEQVLGRAADTAYVDDALGLDGVRYRFAHTGGADLVIAQPRPGSEAMTYFDEHGAGSYLTVFRVLDPDAVRARASERGFRAGGGAAEQAGVLLDESTGVRIQVTGAADD